MKIRSGFVSNSSSSSFVCEVGKPFSCPIEVAHHMILEREWPNDVKLIEMLKQLVRSGDVKPNDNLCFRSTNYDSYVYFNSTNNRIHIYTCNNSDWRFPGGVRYDDGEEGAYQGSQQNEFVMIESGLRGQRISDEVSIEIHNDIKSGRYFDTICNDCHEFLWYAPAELIVFCPVCGKRKFTKNGISGKWEKV